MQNRDEQGNQREERREERRSRWEPKPQVFEWVPRGKPAFQWMLMSGIIAWVISGLILQATVDSAYGLTFVVFLIFFPLGYIFNLIYNLFTMDFINQKGLDQFQSEVHRFRRWMDHRNGQSGQSGNDRNSRNDRSGR